MAQSDRGGGGRDDSLPPAGTRARRRKTDHRHRGPDRRVGERRGLGFAARRDDEADRDRRQRARLSSYLKSLPRSTLDLWVDGLWLGTATDAQLAALRSAVASANADAADLGRGFRRVARPRANGLIAGRHPVFDASTRVDWQVLSHQLTALSKARQKHRAPMNRTRGGGPRSVEIRLECLQSAVGRRADQAGLFTEFFDNSQLVPDQMAAMLVHRELQQKLTTAAHTMSADLPSSSDTERMVSVAQARHAAALLKALPTWQTLHRKLRRKR